MAYFNNAGIRRSLSFRKDFFEMNLSHQGLEQVTETNCYGETLGKKIQKKRRTDGERLDDYLTKWATT